MFAETDESALVDDVGAMASLISVNNMNGGTPPMTGLTPVCNKVSEQSV